jgi:hypothetical protein
MGSQHAYEVNPQDKNTEVTLDPEELDKGYDEELIKRKYHAQQEEKTEKKKKFKF